MTNKQKGILALIIASLGFAFMSIFVKLSGDIPVLQKAIFRNMVSMVIAFIMVTRSKGSYIGKKDNRKLLLLRSVFGTLGVSLFFYSIGTIEVSADANALNKLSSFFLILFSFIFLHEKVKLNQVITILIAFLGSLLIIKPSFNVEIVPYITSILAAICAGAAYTVLRSLGTKEKYYTVVFFFSTFAVIVFLPFVIMNYQPMTNTQILYLLLTGIGATVGQFGTTIAYKYAPAKEISIFNYFNVVFVAIIAIPMLQEYPDYISILGYLVIFLSAYYMYKDNNRLKD